MPKKSCDWSILTKASIVNHLQEIKPVMTGSRLTTKDNYQILANHIRKLAPVRVCQKKNYNVSQGTVVISGQYNFDWDQDNQKCIILNLLYCPFDKTIKFKKDFFDYLCSEIADTILHEVIHMRQHRRRNFHLSRDYHSKDDNPYKRREQGYLGNRDEIDAYGFNIACEIYERFRGNKRLINQYLRCHRPRKHCLYKYYLYIFNYDHEHPVIQKLKRKITSYLPLAEIGKPYKDNTWIWC